MGRVQEEHPVTQMSKGNDGRKNKINGSMHCTSDENRCKHNTWNMANGGVPEHNMSLKLHQNTVSSFWAMKCYTWTNKAINRHDVTYSSSLNVQVLCRKAEHNRCCCEHRVFVSEVYGWHLSTAPLSAWHVKQEVWQRTMWSHQRAPKSSLTPLWMWWKNSQKKKKL